MKDQMTLVQARLPEADARRLDADAGELGLGSRSEAVREGLRLLHRRARDAALARDYDEFYGGAAPLGDVTAIGADVAAGTITAREAAE
jgi:Arc/MetJ-type ribon-helix-helix transcriptional regulator